MPPVKLIYSDGYDQKLGDHVFPSIKYKLVQRKLLAEGIACESDFVEPVPVEDRAVLLVHTAEYVRKLKTGTLSPWELYQLEIPYSPEMIQAVWLCTGGTILAGRCALAEGLAVNVGGGFHHAFPEHGEGFCAIHDVAIAIRKLQAEVAIERPQRFRMIAYAFGGMLYDLLLDGKALTVYAPRDNVVIRHVMGQMKGTGELTGVEKLFARTPLARLLLGPDRFAAPEDWRLLHRDDQTIVYGVFVGPRQRAEIEVQEGSLLPRVHRVLPDEPGGPDLSVRYREWAAVPTAAGEVWWPFGIEVESRAERFYMDFRFADVHLNDDLPPETFQQEIPADAKGAGEGKG